MGEYYSCYEAGYYRSLDYSSFVVGGGGPDIQQYSIWGLDRGPLIFGERTHTAKL